MCMCVRSHVCVSMCEVCIACVCVCMHVHVHVHSASMCVCIIDIASPFTLHDVDFTANFYFNSSLSSFHL